MKIVVDMWHPAGVNFYKHALGILSREHQADIELLVLRRGRLLSILQHECPGLPCTVMGDHKTSAPAKVLGLAGRIVRLLSYLRRRQFDVATCFGGLSISPVTFLLRKPSVIFEDDIDPRLGFWLYRHFSTRVTLPAHIPVHGKNIFTYRGFKELAYLHPRYYQPSEPALEPYCLKSKDYVFLREVTNTTMDYMSLSVGRLHKFLDFFQSQGLKVVASIEDEDLKHRFRDSCLVLDEPVADIFSLLHFATLTISSGDTMARESCLLGTPAVYTGGREMPINRELVSRGCFFKADGEAQTLAAIKKIIEQDVKKKTAAAIADAIKNEWEDTTSVIVSHLLAAVPKDSGGTAG